MDQPSARHPTLNDRLIECQNCGIRFVWTAWEQGVDALRHAAPRRCPACTRLAAPPDRERGLVKWYNGRKGYGFLTRARGDELFLHRSALAQGIDDLQPDDYIEFEVEQTPKGPQAANVRILQRAIVNEEARNS